MSSPDARRVPSLVRRLGVVSFFTDAASEMIYPLLPALLKSFGAASIWLGTMEGVAEALSAVVKYRMGPITDRADRKKPLVVAGYALATIVRPLMAFAWSGWHIVFLRALDRIGKGVRGVPRDAMIAESVSKEHFATAYSFHRAMDNAGSVLGPILAFTLLRFAELPVRVVIMCAIVPGLVSLGTLLFGVRDPGRPPEIEPAKTTAAAPLPPAVKQYLVVLAVFTLGSSADSFLLLRAVDLGMSEEWTPILWLALSASKAASNVPGGRLADRFGRTRALVLAWILYAIFYALAAFATTPMVFAAIVVAYGAYYGLAEGTEKAILAERAPPEARGRAFAAMHAITGFAVLPANLLFGLLYRYDARVAFGTSAGFAAIAALLLLSFRFGGRR
jgi:MFS family permease